MKGQLSRDAVLQPEQHTVMNTNEPPPRTSAHESQNRNAEGKKHIMENTGSL